MVARLFLAFLLSAVCGVVKTMFCSDNNFKSVWLINTHHDFT
jgi:hypothetical protein